MPNTKRPPSNGPPSSYVWQPSSGKHGHAFQSVFDSFQMDPSITIALFQGPTLGCVWAQPGFSSLFKEPATLREIGTLDSRFGAIGPLESAIAAGARSVAHKGLPLQPRMVTLPADNEWGYQWLLVTCFPWRDGMLGPIQGMGILISDISNQMGENHRKSLTRDEFLAAACHDIKGPLSALMGFVEVFGRKIDANNLLCGACKDLLGAIGRQVQRIKRLVDNVSVNSDGNRPGNLVFTQNRQKMDLHLLAQETIQQIQDAFPSHKLSLHCPDLNIVGYWDPASLGQVLTNLLENSIKYSPEGSKIQLTIVQRNDQAELLIEDMGVGIAEEEIARIFDRFFRCSTATHSRVSGVGLGLYIVKRILEEHGGTVEVTSTLGRGSQFRIVLPKNADHLTKYPTRT